ncbi:ABC transporter ATP-binding protein [Bradyrhizobium sp. dw_78]|uniref:ABC transporter ATP-binding protein n=1 Tax=Bradyrhizobium sp. dw_78 TaxID=2719793 RepID=UPI001BD41A4F|nr:ABC transporter ATP-binding protein [Bradyrhizobium sp. dw_78]
MQAEQQPNDAVLLSCDRLNAGWGATHVISNISFELPAGETLAILGRNGVGKTTLISAIAGRADVRSGTIKLAGQSIETLAPYVRAGLGIGFVPQEREIFPSLTVEENLTVAYRPARNGQSVWSLERIYDLFPRLKERRRLGGTKLSGGEQQMLSIGRALMGNPKLLLMDEPMEGLAPIIVELIVDSLKRIRKESGIAILLVEQHVDIAMEFTNRLIVLDRGAMIFNAADGQQAVERSFIETLVGVETMGAG